MSTLQLTRLKIVFIFIISNIVLFSRNNYYIVSFIFLNSILLTIIFHLFCDFLNWIKGISVFILLILIIQTFTYKKFGYSEEGLFLGIYSVVQIITLILVVYLFIKSTRLIYIAQSLSFLPFHLGFVMTVAVGMIDNVNKELKSVLIAQQLRGYRQSWNLSQTFLPVIIPVITRSIFRAEKLAISMQSRGYEIE